MGRSLASLLLGATLLLAPASGIAQQRRSASPHGAIREVDCASCHTADSWRPAKSPMDFDHDEDTDFALAGKHRDVVCTGCHLSARFDQPQAAPSDCVLCHVDVHQGNLSDDCTACHNTRAFIEIAGLEIHARTSFPLLGAHVQVSCESCHVNDRNGAYTTLDPDCFHCHESAYKGPGSIDHVAAGFPTDCRRCHSPLAWTHNTGQFDHVEASGGFQLVGAHVRIRCSSCHTGESLAPIFATTDHLDCIACHRTDFDRGHGDNVSTSCLECHTLETWDVGAFDHALTTGGFALIGAHAHATCDACHEPGTGQLRYAPANQNDCVACHQTQYDQAHAGLFPTTCLDCHTNDTFLGATFDHAVVTSGYQLVGAHAPAPCSACHDPATGSPLYAPANQNDCVACHQTQYDQAHAGLFPITCLDCHTNDTFLGATFDHAVVTSGYQLVGAHAPAPCSACHDPATGSPLYAPANQNDCVACHQTQYDQAHAGLFPTTCLDCHTNDTFLGATFDHAVVTSGYQLVGAHAPAPCSACHDPATGSPLYAPANQNDCVACHQALYDANHNDANFPTTCLTCHTNDTWLGADFPDHDQSFFRIYSGRHQGRWGGDCSTCHTMRNNFQQFTCFNCHAHAESSTNSDHSGVSGYTYDSRACYSCHSRV